MKNLLKNSGVIVLVQGDLNIPPPLNIDWLVLYTVYMNIGIHIDVESMYEYTVCIGSIWLVICTRLNKPFKEGAWWGVGGGLYGGDRWRDRDRDEKIVVLSKGRDRWIDKKKLN